jgi:hypothetical protein
MALMRAEGATGDFIETAEDVFLNNEGMVPLNWSSHPPQVQQLKNTPLVLANAGVVGERLAYYQDLGALRRIAACDEDYVGPLQPLHVIIKEGKAARPVLDLSRNLNERLVKTSFRYQSVQDAVDRCLPGAWLAKVDIEACFLNFLVRPEDRQWLRFAFAPHGGQAQVFEFQSMIFGLSSAPFICTSLMSVVEHALARTFDAHALTKGVRLAYYVDDFLFIAPHSKQQCTAALQLAETVFRSFGLCLKPNKTEGPAQRLEFLGVIIDTIAQTLEVSSKRMSELISLCDSWSFKSSASRKEARSLAGKFAFAAACLPGARPFMRRVIDFAAAMQAKAHRRRVPLSLREDLAAWRRWLPTWNGRAKWVAPTAELVLVTDASVTGFGGWILGASPAVRLALRSNGLDVGACFAGTWHSAHAHLVKSHRDIAFAELFAVVWILHRLGSVCRNAPIRVLIDNHGDVSVVNRQRVRAKNEALRALLRQLSEFATTANCPVTAEHVSGVENVVADFLSRPELHAHCSLTQLQHRFSATHLTSLSHVRSLDPTLPALEQLRSL